MLCTTVLMSIQVLTVMVAAHSTYPSVGTRFEFRPFRGARRVYELVGAVTVRVVAEDGFTPAEAYGLGWEFQVDSQWFASRRPLLGLVH